MKIYKVIIDYFYSLSPKTILKQKVFVEAKDNTSARKMAIEYLFNCNFSRSYKVYFGPYIKSCEVTESN